MKKILLILLVLGAAVAVNSKANADSRVYRLYNHYTGEHFYTTSATELAVDIRAGWTDEGLGWVAPDKGAPVYRVYNPNAIGGDHYYTKSRYEAQSLVSQGWRWDNQGRAVFYSGGNVPIYVAYNPNAQSGAHNYTGSLYEENNLISIGWKYKAVAWTAVSLTTMPSANALEEIVQEMNVESANISAESNGIFSKASFTASGNTLIANFVFSQNIGTASPADTQELKNELQPLLAENQSIFQSAGFLIYQ